MLTSAAAPINYSVHPRTVGSRQRDEQPTTDLHNHHITIFCEDRGLLCHILDTAVQRARCAVTWLTCAPNATTNWSQQSLALFCPSSADFSVTSPVNTIPRSSHSLFFPHSRALVPDFAWKSAKRDTTMSRLDWTGGTVGLQWALVLLYEAPSL